MSYAVWLYYRLNFSHRDIEDLLAERGITVNREAIRLWCIKFGASFAKSLEQTHRNYGGTFYKASLACSNHSPLFSTTPPQKPP
jgi:putative transposase